MLVPSVFSFCAIQVARSFLTSKDSVQIDNMAEKKTHRKHFIPLESNPDVFTELVHKLGISESLAFQDVLSLDDLELLAFIPRPVLALILVFPTTEKYETKVAQEEAGVAAYDGAGEAEEVVYFKQTINNACGLYAMLHAVSNGDARKYIGTQTIMSRLLDAAIPLKPEERALAVEGVEGLEDAYASVARKGDTEAPEDAEDEVLFHYVCFVKSHKTGHLLQLDGARKGPLDLGVMQEDEDVLSEKGLSVIRGMVEVENSNNLNFGLMALVNQD